MLLSQIYTPKRVSNPSMFSSPEKPISLASIDKTEKPSLSFPNVVNWYDVVPSSLAASFLEKAQGVKFTGRGVALAAETLAKAVCTSLNFDFCVLLYVYSSIISFRVVWYLQFDFCIFYVF